MQTFDFPSKSEKIILALGAESAGNFSVFVPSSCPFPKGGIKGGFIYFSKDFGDLLNENNFQKYRRELNKFLKKKDQAGHSFDGFASGLQNHNFRTAAGPKKQSRNNSDPTPRSAYFFTNRR